MQYLRGVKLLIKSNKIKFIVLLFLLGSTLIGQGCGSEEGSSSAAPPKGTTPSCDLLCSASKYSLLVADLDGSNVSIARTSSYQEMTHPRVSNDKNWIAYTAYNDLDAQGCASLAKGYINTEIRSVRLNGTSDKRIIAPVPGEFRSNSYWIGNTNEFTYLVGPPTVALKFYRATVDASMNLTAGPTLIPVPGTIFPMDPASHLATNKIVYPGLWNAGAGFVKGIFIMNLSDSGNVVGLSLGRDRTGAILYCADASCTNIMENDPKLSPDGSKVAFMRQAPASGVNGFGWHVFVVPVANPLNEVDLSYPYIGSDILKNEGLPEWIDNNTLIFSTIEIILPSEVRKDVYTMKDDGSLRTKINLPGGFRYSDVFPFTDGSGKQRMVISAEKIGATCSP